MNYTSIGSMESDKMQVKLNEDDNETQNENSDLNEADSEDYSNMNARERRNLIEKRRKMKINGHISELKQIIPSSFLASRKCPSNGSVLADTVKYVKHLQENYELLLNERVDVVTAEELRRLTSELNMVIQERNKYFKMVKSSAVTPMMLANMSEPTSSSSAPISTMREPISCTTPYSLPTSIFTSTLSTSSLDFTKFTAAQQMQTGTSNTQTPLVVGSPATSTLSLSTNSSVPGQGLIITQSGQAYYINDHGIPVAQGVAQNILNTLQFQTNVPTSRPPTNTAPAQPPTNMSTGLVAVPGHSGQIPSAIILPGGSVIPIMAPQNSISNSQPFTPTTITTQTTSLPASQSTSANVGATLASSSMVGLHMGGSSPQSQTHYQNLLSSHEANSARKIMPKPSPSSTVTLAPLPTPTCSLTIAPPGFSHQQKHIQPHQNIRMETPVMLPKPKRKRASKKKETSVDAIASTPSYSASSDVVTKPLAAMSAKDSKVQSAKSVAPMTSPNLANLASTMFSSGESTSAVHLSTQSDTRLDKPVYPALPSQACTQDGSSKYKRKRKGEADIVPNSIRDISPTMPSKFLPPKTSSESQNGKDKSMMIEFDPNDLDMVLDQVENYDPEGDNEGRHKSIELVTDDREIGPVFTSSLGENGQQSNGYEKANASVTNQSIETPKKLSVSSTSTYDMFSPTPHKQPKNSNSYLIGNLTKSVGQPVDHRRTIEHFNSTSASSFDLSNSNPDPKPMVASTQANQFANFYSDMLSVRSPTLDNNVSNVTMKGKASSENTGTIVSMKKLKDNTFQPYKDLPSDTLDNQNTVSYQRAAYQDDPSQNKGRKSTSPRTEGSKHQPLPFIGEKLPDYYSGSCYSTDHSTITVSSHKSERSNLPPAFPDSRKSQPGHQTNIPFYVPTSLRDVHGKPNFQQPENANPQTEQPIAHQNHQYQPNAYNFSNNAGSDSGISAIDTSFSCQDNNTKTEKRRSGGKSDSFSADSILSTPVAAKTKDQQTNNPAKNANKKRSTKSGSSFTVPYNVNLFSSSASSTHPHSYHDTSFTFSLTQSTPSQPMTSSRSQDRTAGIKDQRNAVWQPHSETIGPNLIQHQRNPTYPPMSFKMPHSQPISTHHYNILTQGQALYSNQSDIAKGSHNQHYPQTSEISKPMSAPNVVPNHTAGMSYPYNFSQFHQAPKSLPALPQKPPNPSDMFGHGLYQHPPLNFQPGSFPTLDPSLRNENLLQRPSLNNAPTQPQFSINNIFKEDAHRRGDYTKLAQPFGQGSIYHPSAHPMYQHHIGSFFPGQHASNFDMVRPSQLPDFGNGANKLGLNFNLPTSQPR